MPDLRAHIEALPRFGLARQDPDGWTLETGRTGDLQICEVVLLADVLALLPDDEALVHPDDSPFDVPQGSGRPDA